MQYNETIDGTHSLLYDYSSRHAGISPQYDGPSLIICSKMSSTHKKGNVRYPLHVRLTQNGSETQTTIDVRQGDVLLVGGGPGQNIHIKEVPGELNSLDGMVQALYLLGDVPEQEEFDLDLQAKRAARFRQGEYTKLPHARYVAIELPSPHFAPVSIHEIASLNGVLPFSILAELLLRVGERNIFPLPHLTSELQWQENGTPLGMYGSLDDLKEGTARNVTLHGTFQGEQVELYFDFKRAGDQRLKQKLTQKNFPQTVEAFEAHYGRIWRVSIPRNRTHNGSGEWRDPVKIWTPEYEILYRTNPSDSLLDSILSRASKNPDADKTNLTLQGKRLRTARYHS